MIEEPADRKAQRWPLSDTLLMVLAALRVMLPFVLLILITVLGAWGLWALFFR